MLRRAAAVRDITRSLTSLSTLAHPQWKEAVFISRTYSQVFRHTNRAYSIISYSSASCRRVRSADAVDKLLTLHLKRCARHHLHLKQSTINFLTILIADLLINLDFRTGTSARRLTAEISASSSILSSSAPQLSIPRSPGSDFSPFER